MAEYIEREVAIEAIVQYALDAYNIEIGCPEQFAGHSTEERFCEGLYEATEVLSDIDRIPTADVAPVRHGRWEQYCACWCKCSICGGSWHEQWVMAKVLNFCPTCGVKMDLEGGNHETD